VSRAAPRARGIGVLVAAAVIAFYPPLSAQAAPKRDQTSPLAAAQAVLDAQVRALGSGDRAAYLATIDPQAPAAFRDAQGHRFDGLRSVPLLSFSLTARTADSGDLGPGVASRYSGVPVFLPETQQRLRLRDFDDRDAVSTLWLTFVQRGPQWYVAADDDVAAVGLDTSRDFWELGPVRIRTTAHFLVLSRPEQATRADALAGIAEQAATQLDHRWTAPWSHRVPLVLPSSSKELEVILQSTVDLTKFVAFAAYGYDPTAGFATTAARIYVNDANLNRYPPAQQVETLVHELDHVAVSGLAGPVTPLWVHEGTAEWVARPAPRLAGHRGRATSCRATSSSSAVRRSPSSGPTRKREPRSRRWPRPAVPTRPPTS